jgi:protein gp37
MTKIEWTEKTWNPIVGCSIVSPGCTNCYAMTMAARIERMGGAPQYDGTTQPSRAGAVWTGKVALAEKALLEPLKRRKPTTYFVNSMGDLFHEDVPDEWIDRVFAVMALCPQHTFQVLTKRSARMREYVIGLNCDGARRYHVADAAEPIATNHKYWKGDGPTDWDLAVAEALHAKHWPLPNVWLGVSAEDQTRADERIPDLLATPAAVRFVSAEPLLGPVDLHSSTCRETGSCGTCPACLGGIDWVIVGGESGKGARPMHPDWARSLRDQCADADVPFFFKQWGEWVTYGASSAAPLVWRDFTHTVDLSGRTVPKNTPAHNEGNGWTPIARLGKKAAGRTLDGRTHDGMPR